MKIGVDMDGVLADFTGPALHNAKYLWGVDISKEEVRETRMAQFIWNNYLTPAQKLNFKEANELYSYMCPENFFFELPPLPGAIETLKILCEKHEVIIITKPLEWNNCPGEKRDWLKRYLGDSKYSLVMTDSMSTKKYLDVDFLIDDDPRAIEAVEYSVALMVEQPWNEDYREGWIGNSIKDFASSLEWINHSGNKIY